MPLSIEEIKKLLNLKPHPTCGFTNETYLSRQQMPASAIPPEYGGPRTLGGFLYFLVTAERRIHLHRIRSDQMYHHYSGDPLEVLLLYPDGKSEVKVVGTDLAAGQRPQLLVPGGTFHAGRVLKGWPWSLLGTSVWLRAEPPDVEMGDVATLSQKYPAAAKGLLEFTA